MDPLPWELGHELGRPQNPAQVVFVEAASRDEVWVLALCVCCRWASHCVF